MREILGKASQQQIGCRPNLNEHESIHKPQSINARKRRVSTFHLGCSHISHAVVSNGAHGAIPVTLVPSVPFLAASVTRQRSQLPPI